MEAQLVKRLRESNSFHPIYEHGLKVIAERHVKGLETKPSDLIDEIKTSEHYQDAFERAKFSVKKALKPVDKKTREFFEEMEDKTIKALIEYGRDEFSEVEVLARIIKALDKGGLIETIERPAKLVPSVQLPFYKIKRTLDAKKILKVLKPVTN